MNHRLRQRNRSSCFLDGRFVWRRYIAVASCLVLVFKNVTAFSVTPLLSLQHPSSSTSLSSATQYSNNYRRIIHIQNSSNDVAEDTASASTTTTQERRPCFYRSPAHKNRWQPRLELSELEIGQELKAVVVQELLQGKTGPKLFCEVGVGRYNPQRPARVGDWQIVTAMLRLPDRKVSVARKRAARLRKKDCFAVYVSRIRTANGALEVCLTPEQAMETPAVARETVTPGQVVSGKVTRVTDYGVLVDVGARQRKHGLLHITTVANLLGRYIDKATGLVEQAGLTRGTRVQLQVANITRREIALDFTSQAYEAAQAERNEAAATKKSSFTAPPDTTPTSSSGSESSPQTTTITSPSTGLSKQEEEAWASFAANPTVSSKDNQVADEDDEDYDEDYDEDRDIEDALGLGYY